MRIKLSLAYVIRKEIDSIRQNELVMRLAKTSKNVRRAGAVKLLRLNSAQACRVLKKLSDAGKLKLVAGGAVAKCIIDE